MWQIYDDLIDTAASDVLVKDFVVGADWAAVLTEDGCLGLAPVVHERGRRFDFSIDHKAGMSVADFAAGLKSWNYYEAALALAALNAQHCKESNVPADAVVYNGGRRSRGAFFKFCESITQARRTLMVEPYYDRDEISPIEGMIDVVRCETTYRDYIYNAYEELVPQADTVLLSGISIVDKLAGLVIRAACESKRTIKLWGPDVPFAASTALASAGISEATGFIVDDAEMCLWCVKRAGTRDGVLRLGHFVTVAF